MAAARDAGAPRAATRALAVVALALGLWSGSLEGPAAHTQPSAQRLARLDFGRDLLEVAPDSWSDLPVEQRIRLVADCDEGELEPPVCGRPPALWPSALRPVAFCTAHAARPSWLSAGQLRDAFEDAAARWNLTSAGIGVRYLGDCDAASWQAQNGVNEIAFDDARDVVAGGAAAVTRTLVRATPLPSPTERAIEEADIVLQGEIALAPACLAHVLLHELGHALGFGHSDDPRDVMYGSFNPSVPAACRAAVSDAEAALLRELYGVDRPPSLDAGGDRSVEPGALVTLSATATDPEGGPLTYAWVQLAGPAVALRRNGPNASFEAPASAGAVLRFAVTAFDRLMHPTVASVTVTVAAGPGAATSGAGLVVSGELSRDGGIAVFVFGGGSDDQLVAASGCPARTATFWVTDARGAFVAFIPGAAVAEVNAEWHRHFASGIPAGTALLGKCR